VSRPYCVATVHRAENTDDAQRLGAILGALDEVSKLTPVILPVHPRTRARLAQFGLSPARVRLVDPLGYLEFLSLVANARAVITDSGGIQEETTYLRIPCITMRDNTERPITVDVGSNVLAGTVPGVVKDRIDSMFATDVTRRGIPEFWDGHAAARIVASLRKELAT
jgi:UDP-N-acetylglucosamine 2-epimerase (non-hydrolysing)